MNDLPKQPCREVKQDQEDQEEPEDSGVKLNDLPELPFELILSYLSLEDLLKARAVSRRWHKTIDSFRPKSLCFSNYSIGFIFPKSRWISDAFVHSFICSPRFEPFFQTFGQSILTKLKHICLCKLDLNATNPTFAQTLSSFDQLEELGLFGIHFSLSELDADFQLHLPKLKSIQLEESRKIKKLTLDAPRLQDVKLVDCFFSAGLNIVHGESVEKLIIDESADMEVKNLKNLKYVYSNLFDSTLLSTLEQLKEIHLSDRRDVEELFEQKERCGRSNLKIFLHGFELNGRNDLAIVPLDFYARHFNERYLRYLGENKSRLANEIPLRNSLPYSAINNVARELEIDLLNKFPDLEHIDADEPVQDVDRFLELLQNFKNIAELDFENFDQPQQLFDRLPNHCAIQWLNITNAPADLDFLLKLKSLICLFLSGPPDIEFVSKILEELPFLSQFDFEYLNQFCIIRIDPSKHFTIRLGGELTKVSNVNAVVRWIIEMAKWISEKE